MTKKILICILAIVGMPIRLVLGQIVGALLAAAFNHIMNLNPKLESTKNIDILITLIGPILSIIIPYCLFKLNKSSMVMKNSLKTMFTFSQFIEIILLMIGISALISGIQNLNAPVVYTKPNITLGIILSSVISGSIIIPIVEEFLFRGALFEVLRKRINNIHIVMLLQGLSFGAIHLFNSDPLVIPWFQFIYSTIIGIISGYLLLETKSFYACITEHIASNLLGLFLIPILATAYYFNAYVYILIGIILIILSQYNKLLKLIAK